MIVEIPNKAVPVFQSYSRYKVLRGGRGSGKSHTFARMAIIKAAYYPLRILCTREIQGSIRDSVFRLLVDTIYKLKLQHRFVIQRDIIYSHAGAEFLFKGLQKNISEIKSTEGINICWVEEAEKVSEDGWKNLTPTIREPNSEIWVSFNPEDERSPTYQRFVENVNPNNCLWAELNYDDNPWFPDVLREEMEWDRVNDPEKWEHVWNGKPKKYGQAVIFKNKIRVEDFVTPSGMQFYFGQDYGFSVDPTVCCRCYIHERKLFIDYEAYGHGIEITDLHRFFSKMPDMARWKVRGDSSRPDTISFLSQPFTDKDGTRYDGLNIIAAEKGAGSVEDGIEFLKGFEAIVIHPRCVGTIKDFQNYRWKEDRHTNEILPIPIDKSNHSPDAIRYALEPYIKKKLSGFDVI